MCFSLGNAVIVPAVALSHRGELELNWEKMKTGESLDLIEPLE